MRPTQSFTQSFFVVLLIAGPAVMTGVASQAQTSVALGVYGAFNGTTSGDGTQQSPANQAGGLFEFRQIKNPLVGYEATYSYNRADQTYTSNSFAVCGVCTAGQSWTPVPANAHEVTGDWVVSLHGANLRPFALAGSGVLLNVPSNAQATTTTLVTGCGGGNPGCTPGNVTTNTTPTSTSTEGVFVYGAGLDWELLPHLGLRFQYRGNVYKAPAIANALSSTNAFTHNAEPVIGIYFRL
jgi:opacity protein-like surface antigen